MKKEKSTETTGRFDLIGDIHGHAAPLLRLLGRLGYQAQDGCFRHPDRRVIFLGDFIDRGPAIRETLRIVRSMIDGGAALAVMGNHEFNALCYHTLGRDGKPLRAHSDKNREQHQATLDQFAAYPDEWRDHLAWFRTLPLYLEISGVRVVHAAWDDQAIATLKGSDRLDEATIHQAARRGTSEYDAVETLLKGREIKLPDGYRFADRYGTPRTEMRTKWWQSGADLTFRDLVFPASEDIPAGGGNALTWPRLTASCRLIVLTTLACAVSLHAARPMRNADPTEFEQFDVESKLIRLKAMLHLRRSGLKKPGCTAT
jgi:hypothetical protein